METVQIAVLRFVGIYVYSELNRRFSQNRRLSTVQHDPRQTSIANKKINY